jgi:hypothetical protein
LGSREKSAATSEKESEIFLILLSREGRGGESEVESQIYKSLWENTWEGRREMKWKMTFTAIVDDEKALDALLYLHKAGRTVENQLTLYANSPLEGISDIQAHAV